MAGYWFLNPAGMQIIIVIKSTMASRIDPVFDLNLKNSCSGFDCASIVSSLSSAGSFVWQQGSALIKEYCSSDEVSQSFSIKVNKHAHQHFMQAEC